jgi:spermidine/putrescine-binding protein
MDQVDDPRVAELVRILSLDLADRRLSRRGLLALGARLGAVAALTPLAAACGPSGPGATAVASGTATPAPSGAVGPTSGPATATPPPKPEGTLNVYNYDAYIAEETVPNFEKQYGVKVTYDVFDSYDTMTAKIRTGSDYDITFATSVDVPGFLAEKLIQPLDLSLIPNVVNLAPEWLNSAYDPGNHNSIPYMWWTTGFAYDTARIPDELTSWSALWDPRWKGKMAMLNDSREVFGAALIRLGLSVNTRSDADLDAALKLLQQQKPLLRTYTGDDIAALSSGDVWICHAWGSDVWKIVQEVPSVKYVLPAEGGIRGSDTMVLLSGAKHPIAAQLFMNYMLDAKVSAANTNFTGYMGPNEAARAFIDTAILDDPAVNPDKAVLAKLQELEDLGSDLEKYQKRWTKLLAGA